MKKLFFLPLICAVTLLAGCKKEDPPQRWDYPNTDIIIELRDSQGGNWFDRRHPGGNMRDNDVKITYDGAMYDMVWLNPNPNTRAESEADLPDWDENGRKPFRLKGDFETADFPVQLLFGEFSIDTKEYRGEAFTIDWGNGETSTVKFDLYTTPNGKDEQPTIHNAIWVDSGLGAGTRSNNTLVLRIVK